MGRVRILIRGGDLIDGTGAPRRRADVLIGDERVLAIEPNLDVASDGIIDAVGQVVAPGFIDIHTHWDFVWRTYPDAPSLLHQGVTTVVTGNCGMSLAPIDPTHRQVLHGSLRSHLASHEELGPWSTFAEYLEAVSKQPVGVNVATLVGHCTIRTAAMGVENRYATRDDLLAMRPLLEEAFGAGAFGLSFGLIYLPGVFAGTDELVFLASTAAARGRIISTHIRNEGDRLLHAVDEVLSVAETSGAFLEVSHLKAMGHENWGAVTEALSHLETALRRGVRVGCDVYPYTATSTTVLSLIPPGFLSQGVESFIASLASARHLEEVAAVMDAPDDQGRRPRSQVLGYENIVVVGLALRREAAGKSLATLAEEDGRTPAVETLQLIRTEGTAFQVVNYAMSERDVAEAVKHPYSVIGSDATGLDPQAPGRPHPRNYGTFPRVLGRFVREDKVLTLEDAIAKMTGRPAERLGLRNRGTLAPGMAADMVILDPATVSDVATFDEPHRFPIGVTHVLVNGQPAIAAGERTRSFAGRLLRA